MFDTIVKSQSQAAALCDALISVDALKTVASDIRTLIEQISALPRSREFELTISLVGAQVVMGQAHDSTNRDPSACPHAHRYVHLDHLHLDKLGLETIVSAYDCDTEFPHFIYGLDTLTYAVLAELTGCSQSTLERVRAAEICRRPDAEISEDVAWLAATAMNVWSETFSPDALAVRYGGYAG
jgi:hypothetical protein